MMKPDVATRRKPTVRGGVNRSLLTLPKGMLSKAQARVREEVPLLKTNSAETNSKGMGLRSPPGFSLAGRSQRASPISHRVDENGRRSDENGKLRAYLAPLFDALPCGVLIADSANRFRMANAAACRMLFGIAPGGVVGAAELAGFAAELARVLAAIAGSESSFFQLGAPRRSQLVKVARVCLTAEQGLAADRVYLLQAAAAGFFKP